MHFTLISDKFAIMSDEKFFEEIDFMFESHLSPKRDKLQLRIKDVTNDSILEESKSMNYSKVLFDSDLNIYKLDANGKPVLVENANFETVVMKQK